MKDHKQQREHWIKIVKKDKEGPTLKFYLPNGENGETKIEKITWEEFEKIYEIRKGEPFKGYIRKDYAEKAKKANDLYTLAMVKFMRAKALDKETSPSPEKLEEKMRAVYVMYSLVIDAGEILGITEGENVKTFMDFMRMNAAQMAKIGCVFMDDYFDGAIDEETLKKMKAERNRIKNPLIIPS